MPVQVPASIWRISRRALAHGFFSRWALTYGYRRKTDTSALRLIFLLVSWRFRGFSHYLPMPPFAEALTRWTIRLAIGLYFASAAVQLRAGNDDRRWRVSRWLWTAGCGLYLLHVLAAFAYFYRWSHAVAWEQTAQQTAELTGLNWGGGIWVNYAFTALWLADALWWWRAGVKKYATRPRWQFFLLHAVFVFMIVNGAIIFGTGGVRWFAAVGLAALAVVYRYFTKANQTT